jgi:hypothetical protein
MKFVAEVTYSRSPGDEEFRREQKTEGDGATGVAGAAARPGTLNA